MAVEGGYLSELGATRRVRFASRNRHCSRTDSDICLRRAPFADSESFPKWEVRRRLRFAGRLAGSTLKIIADEGLAPLLVDGGRDPRPQCIQFVSRPL